MQQWFELWQLGLAGAWAGYARWWQAMSLYDTGRRQVGQTPARQVWHKDRVRLIRYLPGRPEPRAVPVLCVPSLINRYYVLDLQPGRSLVSYLLSRGLDVYLLDWGTPTIQDRHLTLDDHLAGYLHQAVQATCADSGAEKLSLLGYCMGGMFAAVYTALFGEWVANLVNLAGPINYHDEGIFSLLTRAEWFDPDKLVDSYGNIPADLLGWAFQMLRPTSHLARALQFYERMDDQDYVHRFAAMQTWIFDQVDFPGETFRRYIRDFYQANLLVSGRMTIGGRPVSLSSVTCPLLTIASRQDETAPCDSVTVLNDLVSSTDKEILMLKGPHVGMVAGRTASGQLWPHLADWLIPRSGAEAGIMG